MRRGQATILIAIGFFILIIVGIFFFFMSSKNLSSSSEPIDSVYTFVERCLFDVSAEALEKVGIAGGMLEQHEYVDAGFADVNIINQISKTIFETESARYINSHILACVQQIPQYETEIGDPEAKVEINRDFVNIFLNMDLAVTMEDSAKNYRQFSTKHNIKAGYMIDIANIVLDSCMNPMELSNDMLNVSVYDFGSHSVIVLDDSDSVLRDKHYRIAFAPQS